MTPATLPTLGHSGWTRLSLMQTVLHQAVARTREGLQRTEDIPAGAPLDEVAESLLHVGGALRIVGLEAVATLADDISAAASAMAAPSAAPRNGFAKAIEALYDHLLALVNHTPRPHRTLVDAVNALRVITERPAVNEGQLPVPALHPAMYAGAELPAAPPGHRGGEDARYREQEIERAQAQARLTAHAREQLNLLGQRFSQFAAAADPPSTLHAMASALETLGNWLTILEYLEAAELARETAGALRHMAEKTAPPPPADREALAFVLASLERELTQPPSLPGYSTEWVQNGREVFTHLGRAISPPPPQDFASLARAALPRIRAQLTAWHAADPSAAQRHRLQHEFAVLGDHPTAADHREAAALSAHVARLLTRDDLDPDQAGLLNLLEEVHDGLAAHLRDGAAAPQHLTALRGMVAFLLPDEERPPPASGAGAPDSHAADSGDAAIAPPAPAEAPGDSPAAPPPASEEEESGAPREAHQEDDAHGHALPPATEPEAAQGAPPPAADEIPREIPREISQGRAAPRGAAAPAAAPLTDIAAAPPPAPPRPTVWDLEPNVPDQSEVSAAAPSQDAAIPVAPRELEQWLTLVGEIGVLSAAMGNTLKTTRRELTTLAAGRTAPAEQEGMPAEDSSPEWDEVAPGPGILAELDRAVTKCTADLEDAVARQFPLIEPLREGLLRALTVALASHLSPLHHTLRATAGEAAKLSIHGGDLQVDRAVADGLLAPLTDLIRHSARDQSAAAIRIAIRRRGDALVVEYVAAAAPPLGADEAARETAPLAAVYQAAYRMGGAVTVDSSATHGARVRFHVPRTMINPRALLVTLDGGRFAILTHTIHRLIRAPHDQITTTDEGQSLETEGQCIPLIRLGDGPDQAAAEKLTPLVLIRLMDGIAALVVDEFHHAVEVWRKPPPRQLTSIRGIGGVAVLPDTGLAPILTTDALVPPGTVLPTADAGERWVTDEAPPPGRAVAADPPAAPPGKTELPTRAPTRTVRVIVLETPQGPLLIPAAMVATVVAPVTVQAGEGRHPWVSGEVHWHHTRVPLVEVAAIRGETPRESPRACAIILWPMQGQRHDAFLALAGTARPQVITVDDTLTTAPSSRDHSHPWASGYARLQQRTAIIPDLARMAREIFSGG